MPTSTGTLHKEQEGSEDDVELGKPVPGAANSSDSEDERWANLFTHKGQPIRFYFHRSLKEEQIPPARETIESYGGKVTSRRHKAQIILVSEKRLREPLETLRHRYDYHDDPAIRDIRVEPFSYLRTCINSGHFQFFAKKKIRLGMPGPRPKAYGGRGRRVNFTEEDDDHLAQYIADAIPDPSAGGRLGNRLYQELENLGKKSDEPSNIQYAWVRRHTWHSWRERYKMHQEVMDELIALYVAQRQRPDGKGLFERSRHAHPRIRSHQSRRRIRDHLRTSDDEEETEEEEEVDELESDNSAVEEHIPVAKKRSQPNQGSNINRKKARRGNAVGIPTGHREQGAGDGKERYDEKSNADDVPFNDNDMWNPVDDFIMDYEPANEAGPSNTNRSSSPALQPPSPTLVATAPARMPPPPRSKPRAAPLASSQATAVAPSSQPQVLVSPGRVTRERERDAAARLQANAIPPQPQAVQNPPKKPSSKVVARSKAGSSSTAGQAAMKTTINSKPDRQRFADPALASESTRVSNEVRVPYYRVTRSKSKSLEPMIATDADKTKQGKKVVEDKSLVPVIEDENIAGENIGEHVETLEVEIPSIASTGSGIGQSHAEEEAVDELLNEEASAVHDEDEEKDELAAHESEDDAQTRRALQNELPAKDSDDTDESDEEFARGLQDKPKPQGVMRLKAQFNPSTTGSSGYTRSPSTADIAGTNRRPSQSNLGGNPLRIASVATTTPINARTRAARAALAKAPQPTFPSPGTKARVLREQMDEQLKRANYQPPLGTRAHELLSSSGKARRSG